MSSNVEQLPMGKPTRDAYGTTLVELGREDPRIIALDADLSGSTRSAWFRKEFPDRFFNIGIAEANMVGIAAGLAYSGKIPFCSSFATFLLSKTYDQMRMCVALDSANVKLVGSHGGIITGEDGASQQGPEDVALTSSLPNFTVIVPADEVSTPSLVRQAASIVGPVYIRTSRPAVPIVHDAGTEFQLGRGVMVRPGGDATIVANGVMVSVALAAARDLEADGISVAVVDMHTVKPLDDDLLEQCARDTGAIVVAEEHLSWGGLGGAVARSVAQRHPVPIEFMALESYGKSGLPEELLAWAGLTRQTVAAAARRAIERKTSAR